MQTCLQRSGHKQQMRPSKPTGIAAVAGAHRDFREVACHAEDWGICWGRAKLECGVEPRVLPRALSSIARGGKGGRLYQIALGKPAAAAAGWAGVTRPATWLSRAPFHNSAVSESPTRNRPQVELTEEAGYSACPLPPKGRRGAAVGSLQVQDPASKSSICGTTNCAPSRAPSDPVCLSSSDPSIT